VDEPSSDPLLPERTLSEGPLPDVHEGLLDARGLSDYVLDLETHAEGLTVMLKSRSKEFAGQKGVALRDLPELLGSGAAPRAQLRYRFEGEAWLDTLMPTAGGFRIVRFRDPSCQ